MRTLAVLALLAAPLRAQVPRWTVPDAALAVAGASALVADWSTTVWGLQHGFVETNPLLGPHPRAATLAAYNVVQLALYAVGSVRLAPGWRRALQMSVLLVEAFTVVGNLHAGGGFALP